MPAMHVCNEWAGLLLNERCAFVSESAAANAWLSGTFANTSFFANAQETICNAFGLGTAAFALWIDVGRELVKIRHYDARCIIPLTWDIDGVSECAFYSKTFWRGRAQDLLEVHHMASDGTYSITTAVFDHTGGAPVHETHVCVGIPYATFAIVRPAIPNTREPMSGYGQSIFADSIDLLQAVDLAFDAICNELDLSKMRIFLSDIMFDQDAQTGTSIPFGKSDCTIFRKLMSTQDTVEQFAPPLRIKEQVYALRCAMQLLGNACGFGMEYFNLDNDTYLKTATEVTSDNATLFRNAHKHQNLLAPALQTIALAFMSASARFDTSLEVPHTIEVRWPDNVIEDTSRERARDLAEVNLTMTPAEYRERWYNEDSATAEARASKLTGTTHGIDYARGTSPM
jgi:A118 family predicted phage portal protein